MENTVRRATVYLNSDLHRALRVKAAQTERSLSELINDAVRQSLSEDAEDSAAFEERAKEANIAFEYILSAKTKLQSSGLTRFGCGGAADFPGVKLAEFRNW